MSALRSVAIVLAMSLAMSLATVASAAEFDGTMPLTCTVQKGHDCLPSENTCSRLQPQTDIAPVFGIDFAKQQIRSPYRTAVLPMLHTSTNKDSLVMQGADLLVAWSALIDKKTGALTVAISDSLGAYVAFGQCKATGAK